MFDKVKDFFLNQLLGKLVVRGGIVIASYLASGHIGASINVNPNEVSAVLMLGANWLLTVFKHEPKVVPVVPAPVI